MILACQQQYSLHYIEAAPMAEALHELLIKGGVTIDVSQKRSSGRQTSAAGALANLGEASGNDSDSSVHRATTEKVRPSTLPIGMNANGKGRVGSAGLRRIRRARAAAPARRFQDRKANADSSDSSSSDSSHTGRYTPSPPPPSI